MSESFTFDSKLKNYNKIGLSLSGGVDSALLLYYLLKADFEITCYTMVDEGNKVNSNIDAAKYVVNLMETKTSKTIKNHVFQGYTKTEKNDKRNQMRIYYTKLFDEGAIDCLVTGTSKDLTSIDDKWGERDRVKLNDSVWNKENTVYRPFLQNDKKWIKTCCDSCGLTSELIANTLSCISNTIKAPCKNCLWCAEKYDVFSSY